MRLSRERLISPLLAVALVTQPLLAQTAAPVTPAVSSPAAAEQAEGPYQPKDKDERGLWMQMGLRFLNSKDRFNAGLLGLRQLLQDRRLK